jgi:hypothetical protein
MTTGKYIAWLICCAFLIVFLVSAGIYLVFSGHSGWSLFPFILSCCVGSVTTSENDKPEKDKPINNDIL